MNPNDLERIKNFFRQVVSFLLRSFVGGGHELRLWDGIGHLERRCIFGLDVA